MFGDVVGDLSACGISILYSLIRNSPITPPTRKWGGTAVVPTDTTASDDVERVRICRNEMFGHAANEVFKKFVDDIRKICKRFDKWK